MSRTTRLIVVVCALLWGPDALATSAGASGDAIDMNVTVLPFRVKDAEFSTSLNAIIAIRYTPNQLGAYFPETGLTYDVNLPLPASCVGVSPDGTRAAVGHNGWVSEVNLTTMTLVQTIAIGADVIDVIHGGNDFAYASTSDRYLRSINLTTGASTSTDAWRTPLAARLHPAGDRIYGADFNVLPDNVSRFDIKDGQATHSYESVYHGDFAFCSNVWISADGIRLFTACGNTFRAGETFSTDIRYSGKLSQESSIQWVATHPASNRVAVVPSVADTEIHYYAHDTLSYSGRAGLPQFVAEDVSSPSRGRWLFFNTDGSRQYVVVQADATSGIVNDFGVVTIDCTEVSVAVSPTEAGIGSGGGTLSFDVTGSYACGWTATPEVAWLDSVSTGTGDGTVVVAVKPNETTSPRTGTVLVNDQTITISQEASTAPGPGVMPALVPLSFRVIDAEYSRSLDAIVAVADNPYALHIYRLGSQTLTTVLVEHLPTSVSVSPDGQFAAVGHDGLISWVNLVNGVLVKTLDVTAKVLDVVAGGNGYLYAFPTVDQWEKVRCVNVATNVETAHTGMTIYAGTVGRLHPGGAWLYAANNGVSPSDIEKLDISGGTATYLYDSPYHGSFAMCGNLWFSEEGSRIYTACGNVFQATSDFSTDMRHAGAFELDANVRWTTHSSLFGSVAVLPLHETSSTLPRADHEIHYYAPDSLEYEGSAVLPTLDTGGTSWQTRGRWHFFSADGRRQHTVVQTEPESGLLHDFAIATIDCANPAISASPASIVVGSGGKSVQITVSATGCHWNATSSDPWINTLAAGVGTGVANVTVEPNPNSSSRTGTVRIGTAVVTIEQNGALITGLVARATSPTSISLTWSGPPTASYYEIWRSDGSGFSTKATTTSSSYMETTSWSYTDSFVSPDSACVYRVRAVLSDGTTTDFAFDYAHTFTFTDPSLMGRPVRAVHISQLRTIVNGLLSAAGNPLSSFTDPSLPGVKAKLVHVTEIRSAINRLRSGLGIPAAVFSDVQLHGTILASTTQELRNALE